MIKNPFKRAEPGPGISVVIPLYNHARYIEAAIRSALTQSDWVRELIVVDDGSQDDSGAVVQRLMSEDPRIIYWMQPNQGAHAAINAGIARATSEFIAILNSDDLYKERRFAALMDAFDPSVDLMASDIQFIDDDGRQINNDWYANANNYRRQSSYLDLALINGNFVMTTSNFLVRRSVFAEVGGFAPLRYAHDLEFLLRILRSGKSIKLLDQPLLSYRIHASNTIKEGALKVKAELAAIIAKHIDATATCGANFDHAWMAELMDILRTQNLHSPVLGGVLQIHALKELPSDSISLYSNNFVKDTVAALVS